MVVCPACGFENLARARFCGGCAVPLEAAPPPREFGIPVVHEDDALRAVGATTEMRVALEALNEDLERDYGTRLEARIGVNTGEVVAGTGERLATGDPVNVAARLEQAAAPGEILLGRETMRLVKGAADVETVEPLALRGKTEGVPARRLRSVVAEGPQRRLDVAMVGRRRELRLLEDAWERARSERACMLFTLLGAAGVGKSRLVEEFLSRVDEAVVRGRCLSYGEGITYWPVTEIVLRLASRGREAGSGPLAGLLGEETPTSPEEIALAFRLLLEHAAAEHPLIVVFDDAHWGETVFLELVEHVATMSRGAPILVLCVARPELLDRRPGWGGGMLNATTVLLEPLSSAETDELIGAHGAHLDPDLGARIRAAAEGNPLFVEEMLDTGEFERAAGLIDGAALAAEAAGDERVGGRARLELLILRTLVGGAEAHFAPGEIARQAAVLERLGDNELKADVHAALGGVLVAAGRADEAAAEWQTALDLYERKGNVVRAGQVRERLAR